MQAPGPHALTQLHVCLPGRAPHWSHAHSAGRCPAHPHWLPSSGADPRAAAHPKPEVPGLPVTPQELAALAQKSATIAELDGPCYLQRCPNPDVIGRPGVCWHSVPVAWAAKAAAHWKHLPAAAHLRATATAVHLHLEPAAAAAAVQQIPVSAHAAHTLSQREWHQRPHSAVATHAAQAAHSLPYTAAAHGDSGSQLTNAHSEHHSAVAALAAQLQLHPQETSALQQKTPQHCMQAQQLPAVRCDSAAQMLVHLQQQPTALAYWAPPAES